MGAKVDFAVCGRFHYHKFLKDLFKLGALNKFYYSYRLEYDFGIPSKHLKNYFIKEYLLYLNIRFLKKWKHNSIIGFLHKLWELQVIQNKPEADILHVLVHGTSLKIIEKYKRAGKIVIGEVVNKPPAQYAEILNGEYQRWGTPLNIAPEEGKSISEEIDVCDFLIVPSNNLKNSLTNIGYNKDKIFVLSYPSDSPVLEERLKYTTGKLNLVCIGQITFRKGQIYLLKAVKELKKAGYEINLTLIGYLDPDYASVLEKENLRMDFFHIPHINNAQINQTLLKYDLLVLPSIEDGFGVVVGEAFAAGIPVIVSEAAGSSEIVQSERNGFVVKSGSVESLKEAIVKSFNKQFIIEPMKSWEEYAKELFEIYNKMKK